MEPGLLARLGSSGSWGNRTEADIQSDIRSLLLSGQFGLDEPRLEVQTGDGTGRRIDVQVGATVIEVKKDLDAAGVLGKAIKQLAGYVQTKTEQEQSRYNGILTDGRLWLLYESNPATGSFDQQSKLLLGAQEGSGSTLVEWLRSVLATHSNVKPVASTIEATLGASSPAYAQDHAYLAGLYERVADDPTVALKRDLWARLLRSALGTDFEDTTRLFVDHTLLVIEAAAIGHAIMGIPVEALIADPAAMLDGAAFRDGDIHNVIESDFFDWLLTDPDGPRFVTRLIRRVSVFNWHDAQHDVLKVLYESVIHADTRRRLGEYYTPDWLAEGIVTKCVTDPLHQRVLDPACGSGTFPFHAARLFLKAADDAGWNNERALTELQDHVFGLDIHPVSVILARITYLLALGDRLQQQRGSVSVPIHLGDTIQWAQDAAADENSIRVRVDGSDLTAQQAMLLDMAQILAFPLSNIDDPDTFDRLVRDMTARAQEHTDATKKHPSVLPILRRYGVADGPDGQVLTQTFKLLCDLNAQGRDSIWGYFVRNQVRPLWLSMRGRCVDVLVGNPPWVAYRNMTASMQEQFKAFSERRSLWHGKKVATHQDLVGLFIARAVELYLNDGGAFGFVTPLSVLSRQQYDGLRAGKWGQLLRGELTEMWDLEQVRPAGFFPVPSGVIFGLRHDVAPEYGSAEPAAGAPATKLVATGKRDKSGWAATRKQLTFTEKPNITLSVGDDVAVSPYNGSVVQGATIVPRYMFFVEEEHSNSKLGQAANKVRVRSARSSLEKKPWKYRPDLVATVDRRFVHHVHLGETITPFRPLSPRLAVLPVDNGKLLPPSKIDTSPGLKPWWDKASDDWETHKSSDTLSLHERIDYQRGLRRQLDGTKHRVVYSKSGNSLAAARIDDPALVIDHALYWMPAASVDEARYLTAILNAPATTQAVTVYQSRGLFGARHFDKYVWRLLIPTYDKNADTHVLLANLAATAERESARVEIPQGMGFQAARKRIREALGAAGISAQLDALVTDLLALEDTVVVERDPFVAEKAAAVRARKTLLRTDGSTGPLFPSPNVQVDLDCEFDDHGVYLWGATVTTASDSAYHCFGSPTADEKQAAGELIEFLEELAADAPDESIAVFHYGHVEATHLERTAGAAAAGVLGSFIDMLPILRDHYFAPEGFGLKTLAPSAGATWRTPSASGADTRQWVQQARDGNADAWPRLTAYNEDDTRATLALRKVLLDSSADGYRSGVQRSSECTSSSGL